MSEAMDRLLNAKEVDIFEEVRSRIASDGIQWPYAENASEAWKSLTNTFNKYCTVTKEVSADTGDFGKRSVQLLKCDYNGKQFYAVVSRVTDVFDFEPSSSYPYTRITRREMWAKAAEDYNDALWWFNNALENQAYELKFLAHEKTFGETSKELEKAAEKFEGSVVRTSIIH